MKYLLTSVLTACGIFSLTSIAISADPTLRIERNYDDLGFLKPIPVSISGFSGEVDSVLKNDLIFMGVQNVAPTEARYFITGSNGERVEGRVTEKVTKTELMAKAYAGGSKRVQAHALADDIAKLLTQLPGIAQTKVAFKVETGPSVGEIYIADYDGHNPQAVTRDNSLVAAPSWSSRGVMYYASYKLGKPEVFSHELGSGARRALVHGPGSTMSPAVSPDGQKIAFIWNKGGSPNLYVCQSDGSSVQQLSKSRDAESSPCWSRDSQTVCFVSRERGPANLFTISANGTGRRHLSTVGVGNATEPAWSPDGKWIAFTAQRSGGFDICIVKAQGGPVMVLTEGEDPSWAPNSRAIIFCKGPDHRKVLSLLDAPTRHVKDIARISESNSQPSWAP